MSVDWTCPRCEARLPCRGGCERVPSVSVGNAKRLRGVFSLLLNHANSPLKAQTFAGYYLHRKAYGSRLGVLNHLSICERAGWEIMNGGVARGYRATFDAHRPVWHQQLAERAGLDERTPWQIVYDRLTELGHVEDAGFLRTLQQV